VKPDKQLEELLYRTPILFDKQTSSKLVDYLFLIKTWSKKLNLVSNTDKNYVYIKHFIPSFWLFETIESEKPKSILDIGSGAGFPGLIMKILSSKADVFLIESNRKKALFLKEAAEQLDIFPKILNDRIENYTEKTNKTFDVIISRAVTSLNKIWKWSNGILNKNGAVYVIKGTDYRNEFNQTDLSDYEISALVPESKWTNISPNLKNKLIVKMKKA
jgi:16S rRNA (guanine527-N7)-methyltransferase